MARLGIGTGTTPNDGTGDTLLTGAVKINSNFSEVYGIIGDGTNPFVGIVTQITAGDNISISTSHGAVTVTGTASTDNIRAGTLVVSGVSTLGVVTVTSITGDGSGLTGIGTFSRDYNDLSNKPTIPTNTNQPNQPSKQPNAANQPNYSTQPNQPTQPTNQPSPAVKF